jgi:hypothetical protein
MVLRRPDEPRRFRLREPEKGEDRRVRVARPRRARLSGLVLGLIGFVGGSALFGSFWIGVAGAAVALLLWGGWGLVGDR